MTRSLMLVLAVSLSVPALAQEPAASPTPSPSAAPATEGAPQASFGTNEVAPVRNADAPVFDLRHIVVGVQKREEDTDSARWREYRELPSGFVFPEFRFAGQHSFGYDLSGVNVLQDDERYFARLEKGSFGLRGSWIKIPHRFQNGALQLDEYVGGGQFLLPDSLQQLFQGAIEAQFRASPSGVNYAFLSRLIQPVASARTPFDVKLLRQRGLLDLALTQGKPVDVHVVYFDENRRGNRGAGTSFGFANVVETAEPIDYHTQDIALNAEYAHDNLTLRGKLDYNKFTNRIPVETFDNPFRAVSTTDPSAYNSPGSGSVNGPSFGRIALAPSNDAVTGSLGFTYRFGSAAHRSRLNVDASLGQWSQDEAFIPFSSNSAITVPFDATDPANLPARSLDGKIDVFTVNASFTSRPTDHVSFIARLRRRDLDNKTPRIPFEAGYARFDAAWEDPGRINVPYGNTRDEATVGAAYDFKALTLEGGWILDRWDRTYRETETTTENRGYVAANVHLRDWATLRGRYEQGSRGYDHYVNANAEEASFLEPEAVTNLALTRRYDQNARDVKRALAMLDLNPLEKLTVSLNYTFTREQYETDTSTLLYGLDHAKNEAITVETDFTASERTSVFAYYTHENLASFQRGRQSGATPSVNVADDWYADIHDKGDTVGAGGVFSLVKDRLDVSLNGSYQKIDGNNDLTSPPGGAPDFAVGIPNFDDTKLLSATLELAYKMKGGWAVSLGGLLEDYEIDDAFTENVPNYAPGAWFLGGNNEDYNGHLLYLRLSRTW